MSGESSSDDDQCSKTRKSSPVKMQISVLVVDDDPVALAIVSAMLRAEMHQAFTAKDPIEALSMLRQQQGYIDLVIADYHMPQMNGSELQRKIDTEFKLPVVMMSADDNHSTAVESLMNGAVFFIEKPVKPDDLKNIWQYVVAARKRKPVSVLPNDAELSPQDDEDHQNNNRNSAAAANKRSRINGADNYNTNATYTRDHPDAQDDGCSSAPKKPKVVWTNSLHNRFLQAIRYIGLEKAVPKKILEVMNVPGLTRPNVASHLQKYREFLRRIATKSANKERFLKSSFASGHRFPIASGADHQSVSRPLLTPGYFGTTQFTPSQYYGTNYNFNNAAAATNNWNPFGQQPPQFYANTGSVATAPTSFGLVMNNSANFGSTLNVDPFPETPQAAAGAGCGGLLTTSSMAPYSYSNNNYDGIGTEDYPHALTSNFLGSQYSTNVYNINNGGLMSSTTGGGCGGGGRYYSESSSAINGNMVFGNDQFLGFGLNTDATGDEDEVDYGIMSDDSFAMDNMFIIQQMARLTVEDNANFADQFINSKMVPSTDPQILGGGFPNPNLATVSNYGGQDQILMDQPENYPDLQFMSLLLGNDQDHHSWDGQMLGQVGTQQLVTNSTAGAIVIPSILESGACPTISEASYNMFGYNQQTNHEQGNYGQAPNYSTQHGINPTEAINSSAGNQQVYNIYDDDEWDEELLEVFFRTDDDA